MLIKEVFNGYSQRIRLENSLQLQKAKHTRPQEVKLEIAAVHTRIAEQLKADPQLAAAYKDITLTIPE